MKPGITGLAQVNGRNKLSWPERIEYDIWYIKNWNIFLDIKILFKTIFVIFKLENIYGKKDNFKINDEEDKK